jgi:Asp-tRNA(Asn)/Glu-tRNA(Gln) amidotransferase A subunit family amidase
VTETLTIADQAAVLSAGTVSPAELVEQALTRAGELQPEIGAFVELRTDARTEADHHGGALRGVPIAVKDVIDVAGMWTRNGTPGLGHRLAEADAEVIRRLRAAGAVVLGKTRTHELAWGMVTPGCRNPRDRARIVGGSSGGSAAAVAAGIVALAVGTDTGGSVRNPAALCGIVGLKTGMGTLDLNGVAPLAPTQDTIGFLGPTVADCRTALVACIGHRSAAPLRGRIGVISDPWARRVDDAVAAAMDDARERLAAAGSTVADVHVPYAELAPAASYVTMLAESAAAWWPETDDAPASLSRTVRDLLRLGTRVNPADYARALRVRDVLRAEVGRLLTEFDALLLPSCPVTAAPIGAVRVNVAGREVPVETAHAAMTSLASVTGHPAVSVPGKPAPNGLPTGVQVIGAEEFTAMAVAELIETATATRQSR